METRWLKVGWVLCQDTPQQRDYFLGLPMPDLSGMRPIEAKYADDVAMTRALDSSLSLHGIKLFAYELTTKFWAPRSDWAVLPSLAGVMPGIDSSWINDVGR